MIELYDTTQYRDTILIAAESVLRHFGIRPKDVDVSVELVSEEEIRTLNREERGIDAVTDVLSFPGVEVRLPFRKEDYPFDTDPETGAVLLGEVYICLARALEQSEAYNHSVYREIGFLTAHAMLHLLGFDHESEEEREEMERLQDEILNAAGITRDITAEPKREELSFRAGYVALLGRPNAGKSTLINALVGEKVAIVSWKPQTTRNKIIGIVNEEDAQIVFVDTPGLHAPKNKLGKFMMRSVTAALEEVDAVVYVIDAEKGMTQEDVANLERYLDAKDNVVAVVNKVDHVTREKVGEILVTLSRYSRLKAVVPTSALRGKNIGPLIAEVKKLLPVGEKIYDDDLYTDRNMRFMAAEIIREKALRLLDQEIPYGIGVAINRYELGDNGVLQIDADLICQKAGHKPIVLGKQGAMIKKISTYARQDLEEMTGEKVYLTLWVRVKEDWRDDDRILNELGYTKQDY